MVSFQCDACGDTVKKPKLDKHYLACHSSVTCLDCSTTFGGPAQFKNHTQCISEAEKYQKGLYKGPKQQDGRPRGGRQNGYGDARAQQGGKYQQSWRGGSAWVGGPRSFEASGANTTPLGTPVRMSPVTAAMSESTQTGDVQGTSEGKEKEKEKERKKGEKKRKSMRGDGVANGEGPEKKKAKLSESANSAPSSPAKPAVVDGSSEKSRKKAKKEKKGKEEQGGEPDEPAASLPAPSDGSEKKSKKSKKASETESETQSKSAVKEKKSKKQKDKDVVLEVADGVAGVAAANGVESTAAGEAKSKKRRREKAGVDMGVGGADITAVADEKAEKTKRKKDKKSKNLTEESEDSGAIQDSVTDKMDVDSTPPTTSHAASDVEAKESKKEKKSKGKKEKKDKRRTSNAA